MNQPSDSKVDVRFGKDCIIISVPRLDGEGIAFTEFAMNPAGARNLADELNRHSDHLEWLVNQSEMRILAEKLFKM